MKKALFFLLASIVLSFCLPQAAYAATASSDFHISSGTIFLGDSTTNAMRHYEVFPNGKNTTQIWSGIDGTLSMWDVSRKEIGITQAMYNNYASLPKFEKSNNIFRQISSVKNPTIKYSAKISDICAFIQPRLLVITLGINGCTCMSEEDFKFEYSSLIDTVRAASPQTRIVLNSIYPVSKCCQKITNADIDTANEWIESVAAEKLVEFIDTNSVLKDSDGFAPDALTDPSDGIHWNREGCLRLIRTICSEL